MKIVRAIEVWEKDMEGGFVGHFALAENTSVEFLYALFAAEQDKPDLDMKLSYMLDAERLTQLQPFVTETLDSTQFDYILTAYGVPDYE